MPSTVTTSASGCRGWARGHCGRASCLYTSTRANRFVIDEHPDHDAVLIVSACSGHGFKHSPAIGEAAARWATGDGPAPGLDLSGFRLALAMG